MTTIRQHLIDRHVDLDLHRPIIDENERVATFLLYDLNGRVVGYQQYRPDANKEKRNNPKEGRYYTYRTKSCVAVFGLESVKPEHRMVFVTEGIFDASRLTKYGQPAIAVLSNDPSTDVKNFLLCLNKEVVSICDSGPTGTKLKKLADRYVHLAEGDLGDAEEDFVQDIILAYGECTNRGVGHAWKA